MSVVKNRACELSEAKFSSVNSNLLMINKKSCPAMKQDSF